MRHCCVRSYPTALAALGAAAVVLPRPARRTPAPSTAAAKPPPPAATPVRGAARRRPGGSRGAAPGSGATPARPPAPAPLVGHVTRAALEDYETWRTLRAQDYTPDAGAVKAIGATRARRGRTCW